MGHRAPAWSIATYTGLTFGVTWLLWIPVLLRVHERPQAPPFLALGGPVFLLGVFAPGWVALAATTWEGGRPAVVGLLRRLLRWRVDWRFYAFALFLMPVTKLAVAVLYRSLVGAWPRFGETRPLVLVIATVLSTVGQAGEEIGWRGYLLPRVTEWMGLASASLAVGAIWAAWHLPLFFMPGTDTAGQSFPLYALQLMAYSVALAWLYWRSGGSLLLTMFMHAAFNNTKDIVPSAAAYATNVFTLDATLVFRLTVLLLWIAAALLLVRMRGVRHVGRASDADSLATT